MIIRTQTSQHMQETAAGYTQQQRHLGAGWDWGGVGWGVQNGCSQNHVLVVIKSRLVVHNRTQLPVGLSACGKAVLLECVQPGDIPGGFRATSRCYRFAARFVRHVSQA